MGVSTPERIGISVGGAIGAIGISVGVSTPDKIGISVGAGTPVSCAETETTAALVARTTTKRKVRMQWTMIDYFYTTLIIYK